MRKANSLFDVLKSFLGISETDDSSSGGCPSPSQWSTISMCSKFTDGHAIRVKKRRLPSPDKFASDMDAVSTISGQSSVFQKTRLAIGERTEKLGEVENQTVELRSGAQGFAENMRLLRLKEEVRSKRRKDTSLTAKLFKRKKKKKKRPNREKRAMSEGSTDSSALIAAKQLSNNNLQLRAAPEIKKEPIEITSETPRKISLSAKLFRRFDQTRKSLPPDAKMKFGENSVVRLASPEKDIIDADSIKTKSSEAETNVESVELDRSNESGHKKAESSGPIAAVRSILRRLTRMKSQEN